MKTATIAASLLAGSAAAKKSTGKIDQAAFERAVYGDGEKSSKLRKKVMEKGTFVAPGSSLERELQNGNNNYAYRNDMTDDYFSQNGMSNSQFNFNPSQYSLSYHRCANVKQYSDTVAALEDTQNVLSTTSFAVFRFCPSATCMSSSNDDSTWTCDDGDTYCYEARTTAKRNNWTYEQFMAYKKWQKMYGSQYEWEQKRANIASTTCDDTQENCEIYYTGNYRSFQDYYEPQQVQGARGKGCQKNYGEYLLKLEDYLALMLEWHEERLETYVEYCQQCMMNAYDNWLLYAGEWNNRNNYNQNGNWANYDSNYDAYVQQQQDGNDGGRRALKEEVVSKVTFEQFSDDEYMRKLYNNQNNYANGGDDINEQWEQMKIMFYEGCPEYDTCAEYQNVPDFDETYSQYFTCTQVQRNNGNVAYLAPHCGEDGFTVTLGVFSDAYCADYIGYGVDVNNYVDFSYAADPNDPLRSYYNSANGPVLDQLQWSNEHNVCIDCDLGALLYAGEIESANAQQSYYNNYNNQNNENRDNYQYKRTGEVTDICQTLYQYAARCDKHYRSYSSRTAQSKYQNLMAMEDLSCDFIESIAIDNYNENGGIALGNDGNYMRESSSGLASSDNMYVQNAGKAIARVTPLQIFGILASIAACCCLAAWSMSLNKSLAKGAPWRPRRGLNSGAQPQEVARADSGIVMGRSQSHASYYMS